LHGGGLIHLPGAVWFIGVAESDLSLDGGISLIYPAQERLGELFSACALEGVPPNEFDGCRSQQVRKLAHDAAGPVVEELSEFAQRPWLVSDEAETVFKRIQRFAPQFTDVRTRSAIRVKLNDADSLTELTAGRVCEQAVRAKLNARVNLSGAQILGKLPQEVLGIFERASATGHVLCLVESEQQGPVFTHLPRLPCAGADLP